MILKQDSGIGRFDGFQSITGLLKPHRRSEQVNVLVDSLHPVRALNDLRGFLKRKGIALGKVSFHELPDRTELVKRCMLGKETDSILGVPKGFFGLVFSDGLFNKSPPIIHGTLLEELTRVLDPQQGLAMIRWVAKWPGKVQPESRLDISERTIENGAAGIWEIVGGATGMGALNPRVLNLVKTRLKGQGRCTMSVATPLVLSNLVSTRMLPEEMDIIVHENGAFEFFIEQHAIMELLRMLGGRLQSAPLHVMESLLSVQRERGENFWVNRFVLTKYPDITLPPHLAT